jgi:predicted Zn-dependent protease
MGVTDAIMQPYVDAPTLLDAEQELDRLAGLRDELPVPLGDLYDDLAEAAANDDEYALAARLEANALEAGCRERLVAREMRGWYLLKAEDTEAGEAIFRELLAERPDDADVWITLGHARSDAGLQDAALEAFDDALAAAKRRGYRKEIDRARIERRAGCCGSR